MLATLFSGDIVFFSVPAVAGTFFFILRLLMTFAGMGDVHGHGDLAGHIDTTHMDAAGADPHHSTELFKFLSVQSIAAFLMGFGWGGVGGLRGGGWNFGTALACALAGGVAMVWLLSWLLKLVYDLQSSGTVSIMQAMDAEGEVYVTVPAPGKGSGQVKLVINDRQRIYNAVSESDPLPTNTRVKVARVNENNTLTVTKV